ncbi:MaoC/PaaZ C-terminal domain-containing protein [Nocardioides sp. LML1-1-1.1]|uniref:MaoC/PaaZ C-terminal domain-containing protein n=1 Tax=Nocardioides sp. LML1-1-1.1 TaxID=3135248 RepID=UPI003442EF8D
MTTTTTATAWEVGHEFEPLAIDPISRTTLALFAGASGDHNPIHIDIDVAKSAGLDDVFAQGMLSMAYLARAVTNIVPQEQVRKFGVRFTSITPLHAQPTCYVKVDSIDDSSGERLADLSVAVRLADGTRTLEGHAVVALDGTVGGTDA